MTVGQNVAYGLATTGVGKQERQRRVAEALELVRLPDIESRKPAQLSGGQQQRVALARALINRPRVLLLDEPLGALDLKLRKEMQLELKNLNREIGITFIYVTHDQDEALTMSDRIAVMNNGRILQLGDPQSIYEHPQSRFVAEFIGETNILHGTVDAVEGDWALIALPGAGQVRALRTTSEMITPGTAVDVAVRPERATIRRTSGLSELPGAGNQLDGVIVDAIYLGAQTQYSVRIANGQRFVVHMQNSSGRSADFQIGDRILLLLFPRGATLLVS
ncbi:MAG: ABC transporter ATP-binding protein, partial [Thermomicrobiales bacterium]|nr:ABC transporter ATP-binding protein [Thermomicrobiales bacterium]